MGSSRTPDKGVRDMTEISNIDELGINRNLKVRYDRDEIYVSFFKTPPNLSSFRCSYFLLNNNQIGFP